MRLLRRNDTGRFNLSEFGGNDSVPPYAILSHMWLAEEDEPTFKDLLYGTGQNKKGYEKIRFCGKQAEQDGLQYFWVDTCCIDKENKAELSEAINSMFHWYRNSTRCYVYLSDVPNPSYSAEHTPLRMSWASDFSESRWFSRGWTLQELLAPRSVTLFSREHVPLGDKGELPFTIHQITKVPTSALEGSPLFQFGVDERFRWMQGRTTKVAEDMVYSSLGIFDVRMPLYYGEGAASACRRLREEMDRGRKCIQDLRATDPGADKKRIEDTKGGLLEGSYRWILSNPEFQQWRNAEQSALLWVKGDPGKGKTMLLCGVIDQLDASTAGTGLLSYFFCQATDSRLNNANAVLRGLIYMFVSHQPFLVSHVRKNYDEAGESLFEDANAWNSLSEILTNILTNILQDPRLKVAYLIIDALDECVTDLGKLLDFVTKSSCLTPRVKWIVSSRNWPTVAKGLDNAEQKQNLCLELNEKSISAAVDFYIQWKVNELAERKKYNIGTRNAVQRQLSLNADGTFLWVALVCQEISDTPEWKVQEKLAALPPRLDALYKRMMDQIRGLKDADVCKNVLAVVSTVYRPLVVDELVSLIDNPNGISMDVKDLSEIIGLCGSFLTLRENIISFIHQSAKDFLVREAHREIYPSGTQPIHQTIFLRSLQVMSRCLRRDIYNVGDLGRSIDQVKQPDPDPLSSARYSCIYWIDHLLHCDFTQYARNDLRNGGSVQRFLSQSYLYWLEALSLCRRLSEAVKTMAKLEALLQGRADTTALFELVRDAHCFVIYNKVAVQDSPLQVYASALLFSPAGSLIKSLFKHEEPRWITIKPPLRDRWGVCLQTLKGHSAEIDSVAFTSDSTRLASGSYDRTVKIWDPNSGACLQTLEGHRAEVVSVAFSHDFTPQLASASHDRTVKIWDLSSGVCVHTLEGHSAEVESVAFSYDSTSRLASGSCDRTVKIWDLNSGVCLHTLKGHRGEVKSVAFSHDSLRLASGSLACTVKIWDPSSSACLQTLEEYSLGVESVAFSHDSTRLALGSGLHRYDNRVKIWDPSSGACLQTLEGHSAKAESVAFSHDSLRLASGSKDRTVKIWDSGGGAYLQMLEGHSDRVASVAFSHDSTRLASASHDGTIKLWDTRSGACLQTFEGHGFEVEMVTFSHDSTRLASGSYDLEVKIWDTSSGACLQTLEDHTEGVESVAFSRDSTRLASGSCDWTVKIWDSSSGGACLQTLVGHTDIVVSVAFSHDSTRLASGSCDHTVKIWDPSSGGACLQTLKGHSDRVVSVAFSHDSTRLASGSDDGTVKIWDLSSGACLQTLQIGRTLYNISFNDIGSCLYTEIGAIPLSASSSLHTTPVSEESPNPCHQVAGVSLDNVWITYNSRKVLWVPPEYRPFRATVSAGMVGIGLISGKVWMCGFDVNNSPEIP